MLFFLLGLLYFFLRLCHCLLRFLFGFWRASFSSSSSFLASSISSFASATAFFASCLALGVPSSSALFLASFAVSTAFFASCLALASALAVALTTFSAALTFTSSAWGSTYTCPVLMFFKVIQPPLASLPRIMFLSFIILTSITSTNVPLRKVFRNTLPHSASGVTPAPRSKVYGPGTNSGLGGGGGVVGSHGKKVDGAKVVMAALDQSGICSGCDHAARVEVAKKTSAYMNVWMR